MSGPEDHQTAVAPRATLEDRLDSWKAIAAYLGRGVRTVQRWERDEGLPVHRLAHEKRGSVYAQKREVDTWWESRRVSLTADPGDEGERSAAPGAPRMERITWASAATFWPALSSDGRLLAYVSDGGRDGTTPQIWLQQIGGTAVCITSGVLERSHLAFTDGDRRIVFTGTDATTSNVYTMPTLGGEPRIVKRAALGGRPSPDGRWLAFVAIADPAGVRISALDAPEERAVAASLIDVSYVIWSPDSEHVLVQAHADPAAEPEFWIVPIDGGEPVNTGVLQHLRQRGFFPLTLPAAWGDMGLVFSVITQEGVRLARQPLAPVTFQPKGEADLLTHGAELDCFPTASAGRVAFVNTHMDQNLWSAAIDPVSGKANGALRRLTRGPGFLAHLSVSRDGRTLAYFLARRHAAGPVLRNLETDVETPFAPADQHGFIAISPSGSLLASSTRLPGPRAMRPIYVGSIADETMRKLVDDCGGRPREWVDERFLTIERFGSSLNSIALIDTEAGEQFDLLSSPAYSISNARVSPDGRWIAFDATTRGVNRALTSGLTAGPAGRPTVFVAPMRSGTVIPPADWMAVEPSASHPFWSADGSFLYYLPTIPSTDFRNVVRARPFEAATGTLGEAFTALTLTEMIVPASMAGTAPVATRDRIVLVLGDFRGDVWLMDFTRGQPAREA